MVWGKSYIIETSIRLTVTVYSPSRELTVDRCLTEVSSVNLVKSTKNVDSSSKPLENRVVFSPKLTACDENTKNTSYAIK